MVIPRQNKDVCRECDRVVWMHNRSSVHFKWCKGCKRFLNLFRFGEKVDAAKCERCRHRGRQSYLAKKIRNGPNTSRESAALNKDGDPTGESSTDDVETRSVVKKPLRMPRSKSRGHFPAGMDSSSPSKNVDAFMHALAATQIINDPEKPARRPRSLSEGSWVDGGPIVLKALDGQKAAIELKPPGETRCQKIVWDSSPQATTTVTQSRREILPCSGVVGVRRFRTLSQAFGSPLEAFSAICCVDSSAEALRGAKRRKRALSFGDICSSNSNDESKEAATLRPRTSSVSDLAVVAASLLQPDFSRMQRKYRRTGRDSGKSICPALYELASVHTRIVKLEEDAQRVPGLLGKLSNQSVDLLHWRGECERLEAQLHQHRGEAIMLLRELRQLRNEIAVLRTSKLPGGKIVLPASAGGSDPDLSKPEKRL